MFLKKFITAMTAIVMSISLATVAAQEGKKKAEEASPLVKKVLGNLQKQKEPNFDTAIKELETGIKADPKDHDARMLLVKILETSGMRAAQEDEKGEKKGDPYFLKAAAALRDLQKFKKEQSQQEKDISEMVFYNEACVLAKDGKADAAMLALKDCFASGVNNIALLTNDKDLESLRKRDDFKTMLKELTVKAAEEARKEFRELIANQKSFPFDFELKDLDGKKVKLSDYKGKYTIVDIWGTWCPPCRAEIPHFIELLGKYKSKGLEIVGINYEGSDDEKEAIDTIKKFNATMKVPYTCVIGDEKTQKQVPNFQGYPTTLFLDRSGKVRMMVVGGEPLFRLEAAVEALMESDRTDAEKSSKPQLKF